MNFESDRLVLDYLGEVATIAQRRLKPADRMRLVERLRSQIHSQREASGSESPASVRRILDRLGSAETLVANEAFRSPGYEAAKAAQATEDKADGQETDHPGLGHMFGGSGGPGSIAQQIGFRPDTTPLPDPRTGLPRTAVGAVPQVPRQATAAQRDESWWRIRPGRGTGMDMGTAAPGKGDFGPAYPIGLAPLPETEGEVDEFGEPVAPDAVVGLSAWDFARTRPREILAVLVLVLGVAVGSAAVCVIGFLAVFAAYLWTDGEKRTAGFLVPGAVVTGYAVAAWLRAKGKWGPDRTLDPDLPTPQEWFWQQFEVMVRISAALAVVYLVWRLWRYQQGVAAPVAA